MTEKEKKAEIVCYWWDRAQESLEAARRELAADSYNFAMNRVYYAKKVRQREEKATSDQRPGENPSTKARSLCFLRSCQRVTGEPYRERATLTTKRETRQEKF